jgi:hypothetical protein
LILDNAGTIAQILAIIIQIGAIFYGGLKFFTKINVRLDRLEEQYKPNGGSSMRDAVNRIELKLSKLEGKLEQHTDDHNI